MRFRSSATQCSFGEWHPTAASGAEYNVPLCRVRILLTCFCTKAFPDIANVVCTDLPSIVSSEIALPSCVHIFFSSRPSKLFVIRRHMTYGLNGCIVQVCHLASFISCRFVTKKKKKSVTPDLKLDNASFKRRFGRKCPRGSLPER